MNVATRIWVSHSCGRGARTPGAEERIGNDRGGCCLAKVGIAARHIQGWGRQDRIERARRKWPQRAWEGWMGNEGEGRQGVRGESEEWEGGGWSDYRAEGMGGRPFAQTRLVVKLLEAEDTDLGDIFVRRRTMGSVGREILVITTIFDIECSCFCSTSSFLQIDLARHALNEGPEEHKDSTTRSIYSIASADDKPMEHGPFSSEEDSAAEESEGAEACVGRQDVRLPSTTAFGYNHEYGERMCGGS
ncbi:hypothetical protein B0H13DRAFT_1889349 [Mycena leptocephala]|nr:hypothetical protein B0H13DRAFT_1889349 [Mycena leptocephala]